MSISTLFFKKNLLFAFLVGAFCASAIHYFWLHNEFSDNEFSDQGIVSEGDTISSLKASLEQKENELRRLRSHTFGQRLAANNSSALLGCEKNGERFLGGSDVTILVLL
jgi:hypothetical protein